MHCNSCGETEEIYQLENAEEVGVDRSGLVPVGVWLIKLEKSSCPPSSPVDLLLKCIRVKRWPSVRTSNLIVKLNFIFDTHHIPPLKEAIVLMI